ncbi:STAS domain-containing protein [Christensenellaceae bacterium OttesenSCG-928-K19]|nr:STAS domain-containing protein [Christensenellaceae bacterium OttesenSCG-928-K19]
MLLEINKNEAERTLDVMVEGDIDVNSVRQLKKELEENIEAFQPDVIIDCSKLNYIDSTGLGTLVSVLKKVQKYDGKIRITALKPYLFKIFEVTGLAGLFEIEVAEA